MNEFIEKIKQHAEKVKQLQPNIQTEEATKMSMVVPFFQLLGYDVFNPSEFCPEYTADVGIKKGEKVDYAIFENGNPIILIECKWCGESLDKHSSQLFRYYGTTTAKFGILTNGVVYKFYTDLEETNKMDLSPFLEINLLDLKDRLLGELKKFCKTNFDSDNIFGAAEELKYTGLMKGVLASELESPSDDFIRFLLQNTYEGVKTQKVVDKFRPIAKKSMTEFINDLVNQKISAALHGTTDTPEATTEEVKEDECKPTSKIVTTEEEIQAFYIIRGILAGAADVNDIAHRDTESYFGILYQDNNRKPICRLNFDTKQKQILIPDENKNFTRYYIESINDIYGFKDQLVEVVKRYSEK